MMIVFYKKTLKGKLRNYLLFSQILFFLLIVISLVNSGNLLLHKKDIISVHPLKFIHAGLMCLILNSLFLYGETLGLNNELRKFRIIIYPSSIAIISIGLFDILMNYEMDELAFICAILGLVTLLGGLILSIKRYKKLG